MSPIIIGLIGIGVLLLLLFFKVPVAISMAVAGFAGFAYLGGIGGALGVLGASPFANATSYSMSVIPLFVLMGLFAFRAGISQDAYSVAHVWLGRLPGGLAMATIGGCAAFAAVCGSSAATAATMGTVALPEMKKRGYDDALAAGTVAAGGTLGILIPPSITFVIYGVLTEQSVGRLLISGIIPGLLEAALFIVTIYILCRRNPRLGPRGPKTSWKDKFVGLRGVWGVLTLFILVMGGIYMGVFTPTEGGAVGAFGAFLLIIVKRRFTRRTLTDALLETGQMTAMIMFIFIGAMIFSYFLTISQLPMQIANWVAGLQVNKYIVMALILLVYVFLGSAMEAVSIMLVVTPVVFPLVLAMGFDPIWFGVVMVIVVEMGFITPPEGVNMWVIKGIAKDIPLGTIFRGVVPFIIAQLVTIGILIAFPQIALVLPNLMMGK